MEPLIAELEKIRAHNNSCTVKIVDGLTVNTRNILKRIELYYNSKYETGDKNDLGLDKPFYNIVKFRCNIATVATDIDTKDIILLSDNPDMADRLWMYRKEVHKWMKESEFGSFLNELGKNRPKYGSCIVKKTMDEDELVLEVCNIHNVIFDPADFSKHSPLFEIHYMSPSEMWEKKDIWDNVEKAMDLGFTRGRKDEYKKGDIKVIEFVGCVDGKLIDEEGYPFYHIIYAVGTGEAGTLLYKEELDVGIYKKVDWDSVPGRSLGVGVVEDGFEAQRWTNDLVQRQKALIDISSKMIFHTDDPSLGNNVLIELENGDVVKTDEGKTFTQVNNVPSQLPALDSHIAQWDKQLERSTSTYNAFTGDSMPSGTPYRAVATLQQAAQSMYQYKMEEVDLFLQEVFEDWVFPYIEKRLNKAHILAEDFTAEELIKIDESFAHEEATKFAIDTFVNGGNVDSVTYQQAYDEALRGIRANGSRRFLDIPAGYYKNMNAKVTLLISGENKNKGVMLETLSKVLQDVHADPMMLQNPATKKLYTRILELADVDLTPDDLADMGQQAQQIQGQQQGQQMMQ